MGGTTSRHEMQAADFNNSPPQGGGAKAFTRLTSMAATMPKKLRDTTEKRPGGQGGAETGRRQTV